MQALCAVGGNAEMAELLTQGVGELVGVLRYKSKPSDLKITGQQEAMPTMYFVWPFEVGDRLNK